VKMDIPQEVVDQRFVKPSVNFNYLLSHQLTLTDDVVRSVQSRVHGFQV